MISVFSKRIYVNPFHIFACQLSVFNVLSILPTYLHTNIFLVHFLLPQYVMCLDFFVLQLSTNFMLATLFCAVGTEHEFEMLFRARFSHFTLDGTFFYYFPMSLSSIFAIYFSFNAFIFFRGVSGWLVGWRRKMLVLMKMELCGLIIEK